MRRRRPRRSHRGRRAPRQTCLPTHSSSGAGHLSPISPTSPSRRSRSSASRRSGWQPLEQRIEADLALGGHAQLIAELEELVAEHPLRERLRGQLMVGFYRSGRQAEALDVYRRTREALVDEFGIEPTPTLHALERAILTQDPSLDLESSAAVHSSSLAQPGRAYGAVLVLPSAEDRLDGLLAIAEPLASVPARELIVARLARRCERA